jgi:hypothetical protein
MGQTQKEWELSVVADRLRLLEAKVAFTMQVLNLTRNEDGVSRSLEVLFQEAQHAGLDTANLPAVAERAFGGPAAENAGSAPKPAAPAK